ncbi:hypothetical protein ANCDUO_19053, partial [Ancylostoma duodenale]
APHHTYTQLTYATQSDYHYWHERDWLVMIEWAKTIPAYERLPLIDKVGAAFFLLINCCTCVPKPQTKSMAFRKCQR